MEFLTDALQWFLDFFSGDGEVSLWQQIEAQVIIWWLKIKIAAIVHFWGVAQAVLQQLNITSAIQSAFSGLDPTISQFMSVLRVADAMNLIIQAHVTKFILRFSRI